MEEVFLLADLDRTILPNGRQPEASWARPRLRALCREPWVRLAYVSGRSLALIHEAMAAYDLPEPDFLVADVGTAIFERAPLGGWRPLAPWHERLAAGLTGGGLQELRGLLADFDFLTLQEEECQSPVKLSYYLDPDRPLADQSAAVEARLAANGHHCALIASIDETAHRAFLDLLPPAATKLHAVRFLILHAGMTAAQAVYAGDSGNDLPVLASEIPAVLVANATASVRAEARERAAAAGHDHLLYCPPPGEAGNYSAGVLAGAAHYLPAVRTRLRQFAAGLDSDDVV